MACDLIISAIGLVLKAVRFMLKFNFTASILALKD